ncbi:MULTISPECIES: glycosyltransferase family 25 protein [Methylomonas]|nr:MULTISPECIES: glycosyltransferase family 25 protein [Methylomonas]TCV81393.1 GR25 family glycosyltransferase involved in LPS biosynthesis [Methylomonas methanica]
MSSTQQIPVFVISLARAPERRLAICQHLSDLNIEYRLTDAVDGMAMSEAEINTIVAKNSKMHPGAVGCYLSHLHIYEAMKLEKIPMALVVEDDARLNPDVTEMLSQEISFKDWDYCFLDCDDHNDEGPVFYDADSGQKFGTRFTVFALSSGPQTTHAYMITLEAAIKRLENAYPLVKAIDLYDHLPYNIRFYAIVSPKAAWVSEHSLESFTSTKCNNINELSFIALRRWPIFYQIRDFIKLKNFKRSFLIKSLQKNGKLSIDKRWKSLPSGREVLVR